MDILLVEKGVKMPRKQKVKVEEATDQEAVEFIREFAVEVGRAVSLSMVAATAGPRVEDHAIQSADEAWRAIADKLILFAMQDTYG